MVVMASFADPPKNYAPPEGVTVPSGPVPQIAPPDSNEVGELLRRRAEEERLSEEVREPENVPYADFMKDPEPSPHEAECAECLAKRRRAQLIGLGVGVVIGGLIVAGAVVLTMGWSDNADS